MRFHPKFRYVFIAGVFAIITALVGPEKTAFEETVPAPTIDETISTDCHDTDAPARPSV